MLTRNKILLAKTEVTEGVDSVPTAATDSILVIEPEVSPNSDVLARQVVDASFSPFGNVVTVREQSFTFGTEMRPIGAIPTAAAPLRENPLFVACGMSPSYAASSCVYRPRTTWPANNSVTLYAFIDGLLHVGIGCRGNMSLAAEVGQYGRYSWTIRGTFAPLTFPTPGAGDGIRDAAFPTPTYQAFAIDPYPVLGTALSVLGYTGCAAAISIDLQNDIQRRVCMQNANGVASFIIAGRNPTGDVDPEAVIRATFDMWGRWANGTKGMVSFSIGTTIAAAGNGRILVEAPASQIGQMVYRDRNGILVFGIPFGLNRLASAGDDELAITYS